MELLKAGRLVRDSNNNKVLILCGSSDLRDYWCVLGMETKKIECIKASDINKYENHCWNCGIKLDSFSHETCSECHWLKCPECNACRQGGCIPDGIKINDYVRDRKPISLEENDNIEQLLIKKALGELEEIKEALLRFQEKTIYLAIYSFIYPEFERLIDYCIRLVDILEGGSGTGNLEDQRLKSNIVTAMYKKYQQR